MRYEKSLYIICFLLIFSTSIILLNIEIVNAGSYDGQDLAESILCDPSILVSSSYQDKDEYGCRQSGIFTSLGNLDPTNGTDFIILSTGIAGAQPVTTDTENPGCERGTWFEGGEKGYPVDKAILTMELEVPALAKYLKYDVKFLSSESPEWIGDGYNDKFRVKVDAPSQSSSSIFTLDVDSNLFREESRDLVGTGFDIFALDGNPEAKDDVSTTISSADDAGATIMWAVEDEHPLLGPETITVTISIEDYGDNRYDSAVFLDNFRFEDQAEVFLDVRKEVSNTDGEEFNSIETGETVNYKIDIVNSGEIELSNNYMIDNISKNLTYIDNSLTSEYGIAGYHTDPSGDYITWEGDIPPKDYVRITFQATVNEDVENEAIISNIADTKWDTDNDGAIDTWAHSDPVNFSVISFEVPSFVEENFSTDTPGMNASQSKLFRHWFDTQFESYEESVFQVVSGYKYNTDNSFKTKIRSSSNKLRWYYHLSTLEAEMTYWEIMLACGNGSEQSDLILDFKDGSNNNILRIKFEYLNIGTEKTTDWILKPYYYYSGNWIPMTNNYLYNNWYKLRMEVIDSNTLRYIIEKTNGNEIANVSSNKLSGSISSFSQIDWYSNYESVVCPMFFFDEHKVGLKPN